jgi:hypothetical protein
VAVSIELALEVEVRTVGENDDDQQVALQDGACLTMDQKEESLQQQAEMQRADVGDLRVGSLGEDVVAVEMKKLADEKDDETQVPVDVVLQQR